MTAGDADRDPLAELSHYELRHLAAHLAAGRRTRDLDRLLRLETTIDAEPRNGWYVAKERFGDIEGYLGDVRLLWQVAAGAAIAEVDASTPAASLGCEIRCALIVSSVNSIARGLPPALMLALYREKIWTLSQALPHARQLPHPALRAEALCLFAAHVPPDLKLELLMSARQAANEIRARPDWRIRALARVAALAPESLKRDVGREAIDALPECHPSSLAEAVSSFLPHLTDDMSKEVVGIALAALTGEYDGWPQSGEALVELAAALGSVDVDRALISARSIPADRLEDLGWGAVPGRVVRIQALAALVPCLKGARKRRLVQDLIELAPDVRESASRALALAAVTPHLEDRARGWALKEAVKAAYEAELGSSGRALALTDVACLLEGRPKETARRDALASIRALEQDKERSHALRRLAPYLSKELTAEAMEIVDAMTDDNWGRSVSALAPLLDETLLRQAQNRASQIKDEGWAIQAIGYLAGQLESEATGDALPRALRATATLDDERKRVRAVLSQLLDANAFMATADLSERAGEIPWSLVDTWSYNTRGPDYRDEDFAIRGAADDDHTSFERRVDELLEAARQLSGRARSAALDEAFEALRQARPDQPDPEGLIARITTIAELSQEPRRSELFDFSFDLLAGIRLPPSAWALDEAESSARRTEAEKRLVLADLARRVPQRWIPKVLAEARQLQNAEDRAGALAPVIPRLGEPASTELTHEILSLAADGDDARVAGVVGAVAPHLRGEAVEEALGLARSLADADARSQALADLVPRLPEERAVEVAMSIASPTERLRALEAVLRKAHGSAMDKVLEEAVSAAKQLDQEVLIAESLTRLMSHVNGPTKDTILHTALIAARSTRPDNARADALRALVPELLRLPRDQLLSLWHETLPELAGRSRPGLLEDLGVLAPLTAALGGSLAMNESVQAVLEIERWWP
jgi:hypothetical protein